MILAAPALAATLLIGFEDEDDALFMGKRVILNNAVTNDPAAEFGQRPFTWMQVEPAINQ